MRELAYIVLGIVFLANLIQPLTEIAEACRQQVMISAAINNSFRAARDRSLTEESIQDLNAQMDEDLFLEYFVAAFEDSLDVSATQQLTSHIEFESWEDLYNIIEVDIDMYQTEEDGKEVTEVEIHAETVYKFKFGWLSALQETTDYSDYVLEFDRSYLLLVKN